MRSEVAQENAQFPPQFRAFPLTIGVQLKLREKTGKKNISKRKFEKFTQSFTIFEEKIASIRSKMTQENAQFPPQFTEIRLAIEVQLKLAEIRERK